MDLLWDFIFKLNEDKKSPEFLQSSMLFVGDSI